MKLVDAGAGNFEDAGDVRHALPVDVRQIEHAAILAGKTGLDQGVGVTYAHRIAGWIIAGSAMIRRVHHEIAKGIIREGGPFLHLDMAGMVLPITVATDDVHAPHLVDRTIAPFDQKIFT